MADYMRQLGILDPAAINFPIRLIGLGGIGSPTALTLAKIGCPRLTVIDDDLVTDHNIPNQLFRQSDIGTSKALACQSILAEFTECAVDAVPCRFNDHTELDGVVISGVDSMASRKIIWERVRWNVGVPLYIDGRIGGEIIEIFTINPCQYDDVEFYEDWLFEDGDAAPLPCTARAIMYVGFIIGGLIALHFKKWLRKEQYSRRFNFDLKTMTSIAQ